jgi:hypothetical protein
MARCTTDDLREVLAYYRIQAQDDAQRKVTDKLRELHAKKRQTMT